MQTLPPGKHWCPCNPGSEFVMDDVKLMRGVEQAVSRGLARLIGYPPTKGK